MRLRIGETVAMKISGHQTRSVFDRYNITSDAGPREAARKPSQAQYGHHPLAIGRHGSRKCAKLNPTPA